MFFARRTALFLTAVLTYSGHVYANDAAKDLTPNTLTEEQYRQKIIDNTQNIFTLLGAEMANNQGKNVLALNTYLTTFTKSKDPTVAKRAIELATDLGSTVLIEHVYRQLHDTTPTNLSAKYLADWMHAFNTNNDKHLFHSLRHTLANANEEQAKSVFLLLAKHLNEHPNWATLGHQVVAQAANKYPQMIEATIAHLLFKILANDTEQAHKILQQLHTQDPKASPNTRKALATLALVKPKMLAQFIAQKGLEAFSPGWLELGIQSLINDDDTSPIIMAQIQKHLDAALATNPNNFNLYTSAITVGLIRDPHNIKGSLDKITHYVERAYALAPNAELQSILAKTFTGVLINNNQYQQAKLWLERINAPSFAADKLALRITLAIIEEKNALDSVTRMIHSEKKWLHSIPIMANQEALADIYGQYFNLLHTNTPSLTQLPKATAHRLIKKIDTIIHNLERAPHVHQLNNTERLKQVLFMAMLTRGILKTNTNQSQSAIADFRSTLLLNPNDSFTLNSLGYLLLTQGHGNHLDEAMNLIQRAYDISPEDKSINDSLGWAHVKKGAFQTALPYLERAYQDNEDDPEIGAHLGETYWLLGDRTRAQAIWQQTWEKANPQYPAYSILQKTLQKYRIRLKKKP